MRPWTSLLILANTWGFFGMNGSNEMLTLLAADGTSGVLTVVATMITALYGCLVYSLLFMLCYSLILSASHR